MPELLPHTWQVRTPEPPAPTRGVLMLKNEVIGHLTVRIPIRLVEDRESWEIPQVYTYLEADPAELVSHDIPVAFHERMRETLEESGGFQVGTWGEAELAQTTQLHEQPMPAEPELPPLELNFVGSTGAGR